MTIICKKRSMESDYQIPVITVFTWFVKMSNKTVFTIRATGFVCTKST